MLLPSAQALCGERKGHLAAGALLPRPGGAGGQGGVGAGEGVPEASLPVHQPQAAHQGDHLDLPCGGAQMWYVANGRPARPRFQPGLL